MEIEKMYEQVVELKGDLTLLNKKFDKLLDLLENDGIIRKSDIN